MLTCISLLGLVCSILGYFLDRVRSSYVKGKNLSFHITSKVVVLIFYCIENMVMYPIRCPPSQEESKNDGIYCQDRVKTFVLMVLSCVYLLFSTILAQILYNSMRVSRRPRANNIVNNRPEYIEALAIEYKGIK